MKKLILITCHVFLASLLLVVNPAQASTRWKTTPIYSEMVATSVQAIPQLTAPSVHQQKHQIVNHIGCGCSACVKANFAMLQGKLPINEF
jgi:hypothetical protein